MDFIIFPLNKNINSRNKNVINAYLHEKTPLQIFFKLKLHFWREEILNSSVILTEFYRDHIFINIALFQRGILETPRRKLFGKVLQVT